ncbi:MAG: hypothetical protein JST54_13665 [Deltaproteobacteria bacterium]|nr:hypothetical protein [Deltaproteobacteria bacterium]
MTDVIDLSLLQESRKLLRSMLDRRGLTWFLDKEGQRPLFSIEASKLETVLKSSAAKIERKGRSVHPRAMEHCRNELRRELIRRVTEAMMRVGY